MTNNDDKELQGLVDRIQNNLTLDEGVAALKARDTAIRIDELKRIMQIPFITQHVYYDERVAELRRESDQAREEG